MEGKICTSKIWVTKTSQPHQILEGDAIINFGSKSNRSSISAEKRKGCQGIHIKFEQSTFLGTGEQEMYVGNGINFLFFNVYNYRYSSIIIDSNTPHSEQVFTEACKRVCKIM